MHSPLVEVRKKPKDGLEKEKNREGMFRKKNMRVHMTKFGVQSQDGSQGKVWGGELVADL